MNFPHIRRLVRVEPGKEENDGITNVRSKFPGTEGGSPVFENIVQSWRKESTTGHKITESLEKTQKM